MKISKMLWLFAILLLVGCSDEFADNHTEAFHKLYGNGTLQEAVDMLLNEDGTITIVGNQYVRNQDSAAVILIETDGGGNQRWSRKFYGRGFAQATTIIRLPSQELLVLASHRVQNGATYSPLLLHLSKEGDLLKEYSLEQQEGTLAENMRAEDMVLGDNGTVYLLGNILVNGVADRAIIQKIELATGTVLDEREFKNSEVTEAKKIFRQADKYFVLGNTWHSLNNIRNQSIFMVTYSPNLVEAGNVVIGNQHTDTFEKAFISSRNELIILSTEQDPATKVNKGIIWFTNPQTLAVYKKTYLDYSINEIPKAIEEDSNGEFYLAVNATAERGNTIILINKTTSAAEPIWTSPKAIGGAGDDRIEEVQITGEYVYLLSTLDMQNENTLISLSKVQF